MARVSKDFDPISFLNQSSNLDQKYMRNSLVALIFFDSDAWFLNVGSGSGIIAGPDQEKMICKNGQFKNKV